MSDCPGRGDRRGGAQRIPRPPAWRLGDPAPWLDVVHPLSVDEVVAAVVAAERDRPVAAPQGDVRLNAVLVLLAEGPLGAEVLLTRRTMNLSSHQGEMSFPGGRVEDGETIVDAALREAHEEVALDPEAVAVVGELDHLSTLLARNYIVPVVATLQLTVELFPSAAEVDRILWVPLVELAHPEAFRHEWWELESGLRPIYFFELSDETIWGATGRMLHELLSTTFGVSGPSPLI